MELALQLFGACCPLCIEKADVCIQAFGSTPTKTTEKARKVSNDWWIWVYLHRSTPIPVWIAPT